MPFIVGVDAGGTHTVAGAERDGTFVGTSSSGPANPRTYGVEAAAEEVERSVRALCGKDAPHAIAVGAAGAGSERIRRALQLQLERRFMGVQIGVFDDAHIALRAAVPQGDGVVLVAGTGSIAYAMIGDQRLRAGGYGYALGDEGSGYAIGAAALRLLLHAYEGRVPLDPMLAAIAAQLATDDAGGVLERVYAGDDTVAQIAACAPLVLAHADAGERSAGKIVQAAALALFEMLRAVLRRSPHDRASTLSLAMAGGLLRENSMLTYVLETRIAAEFPELCVVKGKEPYQGALHLARAMT